MVSNSSVMPVVVEMMVKESPTTGTYESALSRKSVPASVAPPVTSMRSLPVPAPAVDTTSALYVPVEVKVTSPVTEIVPGDVPGAMMPLIVVSPMNVPVPASVAP